MSKPTTGWKNGRKTINGHEYRLTERYGMYTVRSGCGGYRIERTFISRPNPTLLLLFISKTLME